MTQEQFDYLMDLFSNVNMAGISEEVKEFRVNFSAWPFTRQRSFCNEIGQIKSQCEQMGPGDFERMEQDYFEIEEEKANQSFEVNLNDELNMKTVICALDQTVANPYGTQMH